MIINGLFSIILFCVFATEESMRYTLEVNTFYVFFYLFFTVGFDNSHTCIMQLLFPSLPSLVYSHASLTPCLQYKSLSHVHVSFYIVTE